MKRLVYRPAYDSDGETLPWVAEIGNRSGVYVIRDKETKKTLYVGESHTGRLKKTMLRHLQFWSGLTAGPTYRKNRVEIAVRFTPVNAAVAAQDNLICKLNPRDNEIRSRCPIDSDDPF